MTDITLPIWILAVAVGIPCLGFLFLLFFKLGKIRKPREDLFVDLPIFTRDERAKPNHPFQADLMAMQIDAVFNGLNAIIETERIKIHTLLRNPVTGGLESIQAPKVRQAHPEIQPEVGMSAAPQSIDEQIAKLAALGGQPEEIADETGLSQAEVELALKMRSNRDSMRHRKLEAVA